MYYTNPQQTKMLIDAGLDPKGANVCLHILDDFTGEYEFVPKPWLVMCGDAKNKAYAPSWSVDELLLLMPPKFVERHDGGNVYETDRDYVYELKMGKSVHYDPWYERINYCVYYKERGADEFCNELTFECETFIECCVRMVCALLEKKKI